MSFVSACCKGEKCYCGKPAEHKVEETIFHDDPNSIRHPYTSYICHDHFCEIMELRKDYNAIHPTKTT